METARMKVEARPTKTPDKEPTVRRRTKAKVEPVNTKAASHRHLDLLGIGSVVVSIFLFISLATSDSGVLGQSLGTFCRYLFGKGTIVAAIVMLTHGIGLLRGRSLGLRHLSLGLTIIFCSILGMLARSQGGDYFDPEIVSPSGGYIGAIFGWLFGTLLGVGKPVGLVAMTIVGGVFCIDAPIRHYIEAIMAKARQPREREVTEPVKAERGRAVLDEPEDEPVITRRNRVPETVIPEEIVQPAPVPKTRKLIIKEPEVTEAPLNVESATPKEGYQLPPINLLSEAILNPKRSASEMQKNIETLENTLDQFGIDSTVVEVANGPTVTRYEIALGPGIRVNRITALADNIAMDLAASQVRVEAPIPGKAAIGVEVPNANPTIVTLRELCETPEFMNHPSRLCVALGKDVSGANRYADLTRMPHLLIGGATNSGKSIGLATLITSLLIRNTPKDVRLVMIDPKRVELTLFDHIPHLMCPVIKDVKEAPGVLRAVWREMDRRYDLFSDGGVRNIDGWNAKATFAERLPYIVVVIDELADLMIQAQAEVETTIVRLAQLARAVGIHLVIATQRPSVDVITGLIKANIPSRIGFSVASQIDSRTILDGKGAENLIGKGDMLFLPIGAFKPMRIQGCYVSEKEIDAVCMHWRKQQAPEYVLTPIEEIHDSGREAGDFGQEMDPLWEDAVRWVVERGQASTSMLQRKFSVGFQRASRLLDLMEERSIVGAREGSKPRDVLVSIVDLDMIFGRNIIPPGEVMGYDEEEA